MKSESPNKEKRKKERKKERKKKLDWETWLNKQQQQTQDSYEWNMLASIIFSFVVSLGRPNLMLSG